MSDADFHYAGPGASELDHELGVDHGPNAFEVEALEQMTPEELECTVDVSNRNVEDGSDKQVPGGAVESPKPFVLPVDPETGDDVDFVDPREELLEFVEVELVVRIGEEDQIEGCGTKAGSQRLPIAEVALVSDQLDPRVGP
jgi:hypothetical protein